MQPQAQARPPLQRGPVHRRLRAVRGARGTARMAAAAGGTDLQRLLSLPLANRVARNGLQHVRLVDRLPLELQVIQQSLPAARRRRLRRGEWHVLSAQGKRRCAAAGLAVRRTSLRPSSVCVSGLPPPAAHRRTGRASAELQQPPAGAPQPGRARRWRNQLEVVVAAGLRRGGACCLRYAATICFSSVIFSLIFRRYLGTSP